MSHEHKLALERIVSLCESARQMPTNRQERIHDIALEALGLTSSQREKEIQKVRDACVNTTRLKRERHEARNNLETA